MAGHLRRKGNGHYVAELQAACRMVSQYLRSKGLLLAQGLLREGHSCEVFER